MSRVEGSCCFGVSSELSENKQHREAAGRDEDETGKDGRGQDKAGGDTSRGERTKGSEADGGSNVRNEETAQRMEETEKWGVWTERLEKWGSSSELIRGRSMIGFTEH